MKISVQNLSFGFTDKLLFDKLSIDLTAEQRPLIILGPSGSGKTTLLRLLAGLLKAKEGCINFSNEETFKTSFMFQEPRLLPWLTVIENVSLPLIKIFGKAEAQHRARHFLSLVSLQEKEKNYPRELSGGQMQRVSMARAFAWPAPALFMDEPFQSLDIPLRINLMDLCLSLLENEKQKPRLLIAVTHDPREAIYLGGRVIILGKAAEGIIFDKGITLSAADRAYGSVTAAELEREMIEALKAASSL